MAGDLILQLGTAIGAARAFPYLLKEVVGLNMILPIERRDLIAENERRDAERRNKLHDAELDIRIERLRKAAQTEASLAMAADVGVGKEVLTQIASVLTDEDYRTLRRASYLARIFARAVDGLPPEVDREIEERGGLDDEWVEAFRGWGKVASSNRAQQILAQIYAPRSPARTPTRPHSSLSCALWTKRPPRVSPKSSIRCSAKSA